jgi:hypothetical protein
MAQNRIVQPDIRKQKDEREEKKLEILVHWPYKYKAEKMLVEVMEFFYGWQNTIYCICSVLRETDYKKFYN